MKHSTIESSFEAIKQGQTVNITTGVNTRLIRMMDFNSLVEMLNDSATNKYLFYAPAPAEAFEGFFNPMIEAAANAIEKNEWPDAACLIMENDEGHFLGNIGLVQNPFLQGNLEIGFHIVDSAWRKGIATLMTKFVCNIAFDHLGAYKLCADCYGGNIGSIKVLEKTGFTKEGCQKAYYGDDDKLLFGLTKEEYSSKSII